MDLPKSCLSYLNCNPSFFFFFFLSVGVENHPILLNSESLSSSQFFFCAALESYNIIWFNTLPLSQITFLFSNIQYFLLIHVSNWQLNFFFFTERNKVQKWFVFPLPHLKISFHRILILVWKLNFTRCQLFFSNHLFSWNYIVICNCIFFLFWKSRPRNLPSYFFLYL